MGDEFQLGQNGKFGKIDFDKIAGGIKKEDVAGDDKKLQKLFSLFDTNKDNTLSRSEIEEIKNSIFDADGGKNGDKIFTKKEAKNFVKTNLDNINNQAKEYTDSLFKLLQNIMNKGTDENLEQVILNEKQEEVRKYKDGKTVTIHADGTKTEVSTDNNGAVTTRELDSNDKQNSKTITKKTPAGNNHGVITTVENYDENDNILNSTSTEMKKDAPEEIYSTSETTYKDKKPAEEKFTQDEETRYSRYEYTDNQQRKIHYKTENSTTGEITEYNDNMTEMKVTAKDGTIKEYQWDYTKNNFTLAKTTTVNNGITTVAIPGYNKEIKINKKGEETVSVSIGKDTIEFQDGYIKGVIVQNGESISKLAKKFKCTKDEIIEANKDLVKYTKEGYAYFLVGQEIKIPNKYDENTYADFIEVNKNRQSADKAKQAYEDEHQPPENKSFVEEVPKADNSKSASTETPELLQEIMRQRKAEFDATCQNIATTLLTSYNKIGTDNDDFNLALATINSPEMLANVETLLVNAHSELGNNNNFSPIELVMKSEKNRIAARSLYKQMIANGAFTPEKAADIIEKELEKVLKGATSFDKVLFVVEMVKDKATYDALETKLKEKYHDLEADEDSYIRALIKADGFTQEEIDRLDAILLGAGAYTDATVEEGAEVTEESTKNAEHKTALVNRVMGYHDDNNDAIHKLLGSIETDEDIAILEKYAKDNGYTSVDDMLQKVATTPEEYVAFNTLYYKDGKPLDIKVTEAIKLANESENPNLSVYFNSQEYYFYSNLRRRINETGYNSLEKLYEAAYNSALKEGSDYLMMKSNVIISGYNWFSKKETTEHCKRLLLQIEIEKNRGADSTGGLALNDIANYKQSLVAIIREYPEIKEELLSYINALNYRSEGRKDEYLNMINSARYVDWSDNKFVDEEGNEITDPEAIEAYKDAYEESLSKLRKYVTELEREFNLMRDAQGRWSRGADNISKGTGLGTDSSDVERMYREAKDMLDEFSAATLGCLRDADGNSVNPSKFAEEILAKIENVNDKYGKTIEYTKMAMVLAPIIAVSAGTAILGTTAVTGGLTAAGLITVNEAGAIVGATTTAKAIVTATGIVSSAIGAGVTDRLISADEMNSSITGKSQEAKDRARNQALTNAGFVLVGGTVGASSSTLASKIAANVTSKLATGALNLGKFVVPLAADITVGATTETILTGEVTVEGMTFVVAMSMTGHLIGYKRVEAGGKAKTKGRAEQSGQGRAEQSERIQTEHAEQGGADNAHAGAVEAGGTPYVKQTDINNQIAKLEKSITELNRYINNLEKRLNKAKTPQEKAKLEKQLEEQKQRLQQKQERITELKAQAETEAASQPEQVAEDVSEHAEDVSEHAEDVSEHAEESRVAENSEVRTEEEAPSADNGEQAVPVEDSAPVANEPVKKGSKKSAPKTTDAETAQINQELENIAKYKANDFKPEQIRKSDIIFGDGEISYTKDGNTYSVYYENGNPTAVRVVDNAGNKQYFKVSGNKQTPISREQFIDYRASSMEAFYIGIEKLDLPEGLAKEISKSIDDANLEVKGLFRRRSRRNAESTADNFSMQIIDNYTVNHTISKEDAVTLLKQLSHKMKQNGLNTQKVDGLIKGIEDGSIKPGDGHAIIIGGGEHAKTEENSEVRTEEEEAPSADNGEQAVPVENSAPVANSDVAKRLTDEIENADLADKGFMRTSRRGRQAKADSLLDKIKTEYENGNISREEANSMIDALNEKIGANKLSDAKTNTYKAEVANPASEASRKSNLAKVKKLEQELEKIDQEWNDIPEDMKQAKYPEEYFESDGTYKPMKKGEYTEELDAILPDGSNQIKRVSLDGTREEILNEQGEMYRLKINGENGGVYYFYDGKVIQINLDNGLVYCNGKLACKETENGFINIDTRSSDGVIVGRNRLDYAHGEDASRPTDKYMKVSDEAGNTTEHILVRGNKTIIEKTLPDGTIECTTMEDGVIKKVEIYDNYTLLETKYDSSVKTQEQHNTTKSGQSPNAESQPLTKEQIDEMLKSPSTISDEELAKFISDEGDLPITDKHTPIITKELYRRGVYNPETGKIEHWNELDVNEVKRAYDEGIPYAGRELDRRGYYINTDGTLTEVSKNARGLLDKINGFDLSDGRFTPHNRRQAKIDEILQAIKKAYNNGEGSINLRETHILLNMLDLRIYEANKANSSVHNSKPLSNAGIKDYRQAIKSARSKNNGQSAQTENSAPAEGNMRNSITIDGKKVNLSLKTEEELQALARKFQPSPGGNGPYESIILEIRRRQYLQTPNQAADYISSETLNEYKNASWLSSEQRVAVEGGIKIHQERCSASLDIRISSLESELTPKNKFFHYNKYSQEIENLIDDIALYKKKNWITQDQQHLLVQRLKNMCIEKGFVRPY